MQSLVVFLAVAAVARASLLPLAQPAHHPAIVLDPHGRPLDTAEVIGARALHIQAKALEHGYLGHASIAPAVYAAPAWGAHSALASPFLAHSGYGHLLKKRSLGLYGAHAYSAPFIVPSAVSHQSRVDVHSSPAIVSHAVAAPIVAHALPAAVSHQSRVDVHSSPAIASYAVAAHPSISVWGAHASPLLGHGHLLKKRSLGLWGSHAVATPIAHSVVVSAPAHAVSHQSRVDVRTSPAVVAHSVVAAPLIHSAPLAHSAGVYGYGHGVHGY